MKVLCINNDSYDFFTLTKDKWYIAETHSEFDFKILCDLNYYDIFNKKKFLTIQQVRKLKLKEIFKNEKI